jgi:hypothetical protein
MCGYNENEYKPNKLFSQDLEKVQFCAYWTRSGLISMVRK